MARLSFFLVCLVEMADANGVLRWGFGAKDTGAAGAFGGTRGDVISALQVNPALLSTFEGNQWTVSTRALNGNATFRRGGIASRMSDGKGIYPDLAASWRPGGSSWTFGLGLSPISALEANWNYFDAPGGLGGISYGTPGHDSRFTVTRLALALSLQVTDELSLGASAGAVFSEIDFKAPFIFQTNPALAGAKVDLDMNTEGWAPSFEFGAHYQPSPDWSIGARLKLPLALDNSGDAEVDFSAQLPALSQARYHARTRTELPLTIGLGAEWKATSRLRFGLWADWHRWSESYDTFKVDLANGSDPAVNSAIGPDPTDRIPLNWRDRFVFALGSSYSLNPRWTVRAGYRYGKSPIPNELVTPLNGATLEQALTLGVSWRRNDWQLDFAYAHEFTSTSHVGLSGYRAGEYSNSSLQPSLDMVSLAIGRSF